MPINHLNYQNVATAIAAYAQERWVEEQRINSTGIVSDSADISVSGEGFTGQMRWYKPISGVWNTPSLVTSTAGNYTDLATDIASYIKATRAIGMNQVNLQSIVSQQDGLAFFAQNYAKARAQEEHTAILSILKGIAAYEISLGAGIVDFNSLPDNDTGMFVDLNAAGEFGTAVASAANARKLVDPSQAGAARGERLFRAMGMAFKDYEPEFMYLITSPESLADFRAANLVDQTKIQDGNLQFETLFAGKFRLVLTRASQGNFSASANVNDFSTKTSFLVKPGAMAFKEIPIEVPVEIDRNAAAYAGGGSTDVWYRFGFVAHPMGYNWVGTSTTFATNAAYATAGSWARKFDPLNLSILPIVHG